MIDEEKGGNDPPKKGRKVKPEKEDFQKWKLLALHSFIHSFIKLQLE